MIARRLLPGALLTLLLALAIPAVAGAVVLPAGSTVAISGTPDLQSLFPTPVGASDISQQAVAVRADGHVLVVFTSSSDGLVADDDDSVSNVYVKDVTAGDVQLVSRQSNVNGVPGEPAHADCSNGAISADGHAVAFVCKGPLDPVHDTNGLPDVYERNLDTGQTMLVSRAIGGTAADRGADIGNQPAVAHDAAHGVTYVAFTSASTDLVSPAQANDHVYRRTLGASDAMQVADEPDPAQPNTKGAFDPSISDDGQKVAFLSGQPFDAQDKNTENDSYVRDFAAAAGAPPLTLMSAANGAAGAAAGTTNALISGDGKSVAFETPTSLDARDLDTSVDVYVRSGSTTSLVSIGPNGERPGADCTIAGIGTDAGGTVVAFDARTTAFAPGLTAADGTQVYVSRVVVVVGAREIDLASRGPGAGAPLNDRAAPDAFLSAAVSSDGTKVAMALPAAVTPDADPRIPSVVLRDLAGGSEQTVSRPPGSAPFVSLGGTASTAMPSADGRYVAFVGSVPGLGLPLGLTQAVYRRDLETGAVTIVSRADGSDGAPLDGTFQSPAVSASGNRVAFTRVSPGQQSQVYVRDVAAGRTFIASRPDGPEVAGGPLGDGASTAPSISADGLRVAFRSAATNLVGADDTDVQPDIFVRELDAGRTLLVDRAAGAGAKANGPSGDPAINADGRFVAFDSTATTLVPGDANGKRDAFVRGLDDGGSMRLVSIDGTTQGDGDSFATGISRDGSRVAIDSRAPDFGVPAGQDGLFVRDITATSPSMTLVGRADGSGGAQVDVDVGGSSLSADGQHVAFEAAPATSIVPGVPGGDGVTRVYERDLASGTTRLISRLTGAAGTPVSASVAHMTADGGCVTFQSKDPVVPFGGSDLKTNVYLRAVAFNCGRPVPSPPLPPPPGAKAAVLSHLSVRPARFYVGGRKGGTRIAFRLDKASSVTLSFDRLLPAHLKGRRCLTTVRKGRRCTVVKRAGHVTVGGGRAGANTVTFSGKLGRRALAPGTYRLTATPLHGRAVTVRFVVVKAPKPKRKGH